MILCVFFLLVIACTITLKSFIETKNNNNAFGLTYFLGPLGIFVWGDGILIGPFWIITSIIGFVTQNWNIFFLLVSLFWIIRSFGEIVYWLLEQFSEKQRNKPKDLLGYEIFKGESIYFAYQVFWQMILVFSIFASVVFAKKI